MYRFVRGDQGRLRQGPHRAFGAEAQKGRRMAARGLALLPDNPDRILVGYRVLVYQGFVPSSPFFPFFFSLPSSCPPFTVCFRHDHSEPCPTLSCFLSYIFLHALASSPLSCPSKPRSLSSSSSPGPRYRRSTAVPLCSLTSQCASISPAPSQTLHLIANVTPHHTLGLFTALQFVLWRAKRARKREPALHFLQLLLSYSTRAITPLTLNFPNYTSYFSTSFSSSLAQRQTPPTDRTYKLPTTTSQPHFPLPISFPLRQIPMISQRLPPSQPHVATTASHGSQG